MTPKGKKRATYRATLTIRTDERRKRGPDGVWFAVEPAGTMTANLDLYVNDWDKLIKTMGRKAMTNRSGVTRAMWGLIEVRASAVTRSAAPDSRAEPPILGSDLADIHF